MLENNLINFSADEIWILECPNTSVLEQLLSDAIDQAGGVPDVRIASYDDQDIKLEK